MHDKYQDFVTASERDELSAKLQEVEDWLYEEGEDETKGVYIAKLEELKKVLSLQYALLIIIIIIHVRLCLRGTLGMAGHFL